MKLDVRVEADSTTASGTQVGPPTVQAFVRMVKTVLLPVLVKDYVPDQDVCDYDLDKDSWMAFSPLSWKHDVSCPDRSLLNVSRHHDDDDHDDDHHHDGYQQQDRSNVTGHPEIYSSTDNDVSVPEQQHPDSSSQCDRQFTYKDLSARTSSSSPALPTDLANLESLSTCIGHESDYFTVSRTEGIIRLDVGRIPSVRSYLKRKLPSSLSDPTDLYSSDTEKGHPDGEQIAKQRRFARAVGTLDRLGLWEVAVRTGDMLLRGRQLQKQLDDLKQDLRQLMLSVLKNPENENLKNALIAMKAQIHDHGQMPYEQSTNVSVHS